MNPIPFYKMSGAGNDFIIIDNRDGKVKDTDLTGFINAVCRRKMSVGADGLILIETSEACDFRWRFFNSDGSKAEMCGNGARCAARFAHVTGIAGTELSFETEVGVINAQINDDRVKVRMPDPADLKMAYPLALSNRSLEISSVNTGVPHVVVMVEQVNDIDVIALGREIRFHQSFAPAGTNANFVQRQKGNSIEIRTYERGVEDETLACGTGAIASAIVSAGRFNLDSPVDVGTRSGGKLTIYFDIREGQFSNIFMEGDARIIYAGELQPEAWQ
ncbi:MAG: diaminopimelate epimerase [Deltaproteobacteria bacterium]|jgi:diaminopimelate epimerase|nr:diaminopimelate epimerase [Deltaproteobacteria bacterium]